MQGGPHLRFDDEEEREDEQTPRLPRVSNPMSHRYQKKNIQRRYAAARRGQRTEENTAKAARKAGKSFRLYLHPLMTASFQDSRLTDCLSKRQL